MTKKRETETIKIDSTLQIQINDEDDKENHKRRKALNMSFYRDMDIINQDLFMRS